MAGFSTANGFPEIPEIPEIVVTGVAMTTALAMDADATWKKLLDGQSGIRKLDDSCAELFDAPVHIGGQLLEDFESELTRVERHGEHW
jgi:beta-ketoacyl ACP synthase